MEHHDVQCQTVSTATSEAAIQTDAFVIPDMSQSSFASGDDKNLYKLAEEDVALFRDHATRLAEKQDESKKVSTSVVFNVPNENL